MDLQQKTFQKVPVTEVSPRPIQEGNASSKVFIVGMSRSGTTLMHNILNKSDSIAITRENHFLGHLLRSEGMRYKFRRFGDLSNDENVRRLVKHLYSGGSERSSMLRRASSHWRWITERVDPKVFTERLLATDRSEKAIFTLIMQLFAERKGKPIMGEKTPAHFRYVDTIVSWYPEAKIIHMLRDPRGVFVSEWRRRQTEAQSIPYKQLKHLPVLLKVFILLQTTITWQESARKSAQYRLQYPQNYYTLRFEDLVRDPERQVKAVCDFIGVEYQPAMLDQEVVSDGFQLKQAGFDRDAAERWQKHIDPWADVWLRFWLRKEMKRLQYGE